MCLRQPTNWTYMSKRQPRPSLVLATWPDRANSADRLGTHDYGGTAGSDSFRVSLRLVDLTDADAYLGSDYDYGRHLSFYVWLMPLDSGEVRHVIEVELADIYAARLSKIEQMVKALRVLTRKMPTPVADFREHLAAVVAALGIKHTVQYGARIPTYAPIADALPLLHAEFDRRVARLKGA
jgi:hypothetical protein